MCKGLLTKMLGLAGMAVLLSSPGSAFAADITVTNLSFPGWQFEPVFPPGPHIRNLCDGRVSALL